MVSTKHVIFEEFDIREQTDNNQEDLLDVNIDGNGDSEVDGHVFKNNSARQQQHETESDEDSIGLENKPLLFDGTISDDDGDVTVDVSTSVSSSSKSQNARHQIPVRALIRSRKKTASESDDDEKNIKNQRSCLRKNINVSNNNFNKNSANNPFEVSESAKVKGRDTDYPNHFSDNNEDLLPSPVSGGAAAAMGCGRIRRFCRDSSQHQLVRTTMSVMNFMTRVLLWCSFIAMIVGVVWYSRELKMNGTDPHLIAWFSAGAFVLLGFPISMCGIFMHLTNYYQPNVQCYVVRILWMVPIYSIESWLCLRFHTLAIYIETLRDVYESYVLYSFLQFLIKVLGGEEALILMLKDKSPTRGVHMWGVNWFIKPWLMGQPVSRRDSFTAADRSNVSLLQSERGSSPTSSPSSPLSRPVKRIQWTSPFFVKCKLGVLQYVLLKFVSAIFVMVLEIYGLYKEGDFTPRGGYLYICILTNISQCWALYCLVFFYYATKNELGPIRPVGKFLSVKAVVFFTWWQSLGISILFQMGMIPRYAAVDDGREWSAEAVAKGLQDYLICIEMFVAAIVHTFVFPHSDYLEPLVGVNLRRGHQISTRRLGRRGRFAHHRRVDDHSDGVRGGLTSHERSAHDVELGVIDGSSDKSYEGLKYTEDNNDRCSAKDESDHESTTSSTLVSGPRHQRQGFVRALLDSTVPRDVFGETVGMVKGEFHVEKKTLLHHAATSDEYDLFSKSSKLRRILSKKGKEDEILADTEDTHVCETVKT